VKTVEKNKNSIPKLRYHKASGRAYVVLNQRALWLGKSGTEEAEQNYNRTIAEWLSSGKQAAADGSNITLAEILSRFWVYAEGYYRGADGKPTTELDSLRYAFRPLLKLYGSTEAAAFGPRCLRAVQRNMVEIGWCRNNVNRSLSRIKMLFKWAVSQELLAGSVYHAIITVPGLRKGRSEAHETEPTKPVPQEHIDVIRPYVSRHMWTIIQLQLLTAARPSEILMMRPCNIDRSGKIWVCSPAAHKTAHHGHDRKIYLGPRSQEILTPFLFRDPQAYCFSPAEAYAERLAKLHANRKTPQKYGNVHGSCKKDDPKWKPGQYYDVAAYRLAITRAIERAFPAPEHLRQGSGETKKQWHKRLSKKEKAELKAWYKQYHWHPHQLRHNAATYLRKEFGLETARIILGHRSAAITEVYAELDQQKAMEAIVRVG
jgi:integrase